MDTMVTKERTILIVDDEGSMRHMLRMVLEKEGYQVLEAAHGLQGLEVLSRATVDLVLCDIRMPEMDGIAFLRELEHARNPATVIVMSAYGAIDTAIECMKLGAYDYISKPFKPDEVLLTVKKAEERLRLQQENRQLKKELSQTQFRDEIVFAGPAMARVLELVDAVADSASPVLITGETGTGKELVARALHSRSGRRDMPFVAVNCGAISSGLMESELFGHVKGAFTGADRERQGLFSAANGGVLFLDEIGELPLDLQPKLLRVLQEGEILRVGETRPRQVDVRVLAATARDLRDEAAGGRFRDDLYYRLAVVEIDIPPLRERREDLQPLAERFLEQIASREGRTVPRLLSDALAALQDYPWPGNVRELKNFLEKTMIFCRREEIDKGCLPWEARRKSRDHSDNYSLKAAIRRLEREYIEKALKATDGNRTHAARLLEISLRALIYKIREYDIS